MCSQGCAAAACVPGGGPSTAPIVVTPLSQAPLGCLCTSSGHRQTVAARGLCVSPSVCFQSSGLWSPVSFVCPQGTLTWCQACRFPCGPCVHSPGRVSGVECGADGSSVLSCLRSLTVFNSGCTVLRSILQETKLSLRIPIAELQSVTGLMDARPGPGQPHTYMMSVDTGPLPYTHSRELYKVTAGLCCLDVYRALSGLVSPPQASGADQSSERPWVGKGKQRP